MKTIFVALLTASASAFAAPATQSNIDSCVHDLMAQTTNTFAVAFACAGVQDPHLVVNCVVSLRQIEKLAMPDAATACYGVSDVQAMKTCIETEKKADFTDSEAASLCNQK